MRSLLGFMLLTLLNACSVDKNTENDTKTITFNDFEAGGGWSNDPGRNNPSLLDKGRAHSGQYAIKVDQDHEFSLTYDMPMIEISSSKFKTVRLEAWVFMPSDRSTGTLGIQIMEPGKNEQVFGDDIKLRDAVKKYNDWVAVSKDFDLPDTIIPAQHLRLSLWRADASDVVLVDDVRLSIVK